MLWRLIAPAMLAGCTGSGDDTGADGVLSSVVLSALDLEGIRDAVEGMCVPEYGGRIPGSYGHIQVGSSLKERMESSGLEPLGRQGGYTVAHDSVAVSGRYMLTMDGLVVPQEVVGVDSIIGLLPGSDPDLADEYIVVMAHYDSLGVTAGGEPYPGAVNSAAAVAGLMEIAELFRDAQVAPGRSLIFLITTDGEAGQRGAKEFAVFPTVPKDDIVLAISLDNVGRRLVPDYAPLTIAGAEYAPGLDAALRSVRHIGVEPVTLLHRSMIPLLQSDIDPFIDEGIPALWVFNPAMPYHNTTDDRANTVDYALLQDDLHFTAQLLHFLGDAPSELFEWDGEPDDPAAAAQSAAWLFGGALSSTALDNNERGLAQSYLSDLDNVIEVGSYANVGDEDAFVIESMFFLMRDLPYAHPGTNPPEWPDR